LSVEQQHDVLSTIKQVCEVAEMCGDKPNWPKITLVALARFVKLEDVYKLRACYIVTQKVSGDPF